ncbi:MAG: hypothetical protein R2749_24635 [Acidimicrobiales bacterium]
MCGIIAVLRRRNERPAPTAASLLEQVHAAQARLEAAADGGRVTGDLVAVLSDAAAGLRELDRELRRVAGIGLLVSDRAAAAQLTVQLGRLHELVGRIEALIDAEGAEGALSPAEVEARSAALIALKDVVWALVQDRQRTARAVASLAGVTPTPSAVAAYLAIQESLSAIDRLEVRGRDSAGLHVLVHGHDLQLDAPALAALCPSGPATSCSAPARCGWSTAAPCRSCTRRRRRSVSWVTTSGPCAPPSRPTSCCAGRSRGAMPR